MLDADDLALVRRMIRESAATPAARFERTLRLPATVMATGEPFSTVSVRFDGESSHSVFNVTPCRLLINQRVHVELTPPHGAFVTGLVTASAVIVPHSDSQRVLATATRSVSSATYVVIPTQPVIVSNFPKRLADTVLIAETAGTFEMSGGAGRVNFAVRINGVDYELAVFGNAPDASRRNIAGISDPISGLAAGVYSPELVVKVDANTVNWYLDDDQLSLKVTETFQ